MAYDVDRKPGAFASARARRFTREMFLAFTAAMIALVAVLYAAFGLRSTLGAFVLVGVMYAASRVFDGRENHARRWTLGANAEKAVGAALKELERDGYVVMHDIQQERQANIDHLVSGPTGVYLIETKARWYPPDTLRRVRGQAARIHDALGVWITPVICIPNRAAPPRQHDRVWIVPSQHVTAWIRQQHNKPVEFERLARFADSLSDS